MKNDIIYYELFSVFFSRVCMFVLHGSVEAALGSLISALWHDIMGWLLIYIALSLLQ